MLKAKKFSIILKKINQWLAFTEDEKEMIKVAEKKNEKLKEARIEMNYLTGDAEVRRLAELREKWEMDRISAINHASKLGKEEGAKEKSIEVAKEMLKKGLSIDMICDITKMKREEIEKIK